MSREQTNSMFQWIYRGAMVICLIIVWAVVQDTYATFRQTRDSMIRMEVKVNDLTENTAEKINLLRLEMSEIRAEIKTIPK